MSTPSLVKYENYTEYLEHYKREYCRKTIYTSDNIRVYFSESRFWHAFYKGKHKNNIFDTKRAQYIDWIRYILESKSAILFQGYCSDTKSMKAHRRVAVVSENKYVVVIEMYFNSKKTLCAKFITAYYADKSYPKIIQSPKWDMNECVEYLKQKRG